MPMGAGKYDELCSYVSEQAGISPVTGGGAIVLVLGGNRGSGFSCQVDFRTSRLLPGILEEVARQLRADIEGRV